MTTVSAHLRALADPIWQTQLTHPFVTAIGDGTLDLDRFGFWLRQDYLFLIDYARLFAAGVLRAPDLDTMTSMAALVHDTLHLELGLHRSYVAGFGITEADLGATTKTPTCQGYTDFLIRTASTGDFPELLGALLPCMWGFAEIGAHLASGPRPADDRLARWIDMYASDEFQQAAGACRDLVDRHCAGLTGDMRRRVETAFLTSSRWELAFWEMAWIEESWQV